MNPFLCYEHVPGIIGIKTNIKNFRWGFGKCSKPVDESVFENCQYKIVVERKSDSHVFDSVNLDSFDLYFRYFKGVKDDRRLIFDRTVGKIIHLRYYINVYEKQIHIIVGKSYLRFVPIKLMNLHPISSVLFDAISAVLLQNHMTSLYCSSIKLSNGKSAVFMAPPNTGKSLTVLRLKRDFGANILSEDMAITNGREIWGAPYTNLFRNYHDKSLCAEGDYTPITCPQKIDYVFFLQKGKKIQSIQTFDYSERLESINRYSLGYYYSPCLRAMNYFNDDFFVPKCMIEETRIFKEMENSTKGFVLENPDPVMFAEQMIDILKKPEGEA